MVGQIRHNTSPIPPFASEISALHKRKQTTFHTKTNPYLRGILKITTDKDSEVADHPRTSIAVHVVTFLRCLAKFNPLAAAVPTETLLILIRRMLVTICPTLGTRGPSPGCLVVIAVLTPFNAHLVL